MDARPGAWAPDETSVARGTHFLFASGVENSHPTLDGGRTRIDEMYACGHYDHWRRDLTLAREIGVTDLRGLRPYCGARPIDLAADAVVERLHQGLRDLVIRRWIPARDQLPVAHDGRRVVRTVLHPA
jgi:hypothetical protein